MMTFVLKVQPQGLIILGWYLPFLFSSRLRMVHMFVYLFIYVFI